MLRVPPEGHKSYECKVKNGGGAKKKEKKQTSKLSNTYTNKVDKKASTPHLLKKKKNNKVVVIKVNKQANNGAKGIWVPKEIISNMKSTKKVWIPKKEVRSPMDFGEFGYLVKYECISWGASLWKRKLPSGLVNTMDPNSPSHVR